jgi:hypothetical protein
VADVVLDANAVGQVITFVAPGVLARLGYRMRYPGPDRPPGEVVIIAVVTSLPLVAFAAAVLPGTQKATQFGYVTLLLAVGLVVGYLAALVRGRPRTKKLLRKLDYRIEPEGTIYAQTLRHMSDEGAVVVELKDGRRLWGCPRSGPQSKDDGIAELYLTYPKAEHEAGAWKSVGAGVIIPLAEVSTIALSEEPTGSALT